MQKLFQILMLLCERYINYLFMQRYAHDFQHSAWIHILWFDIRNYIKQNIYYGSCNTRFFLVLMTLGNKLNPCLYYCSIDVLRGIQTQLQIHSHTHTHTYTHTTKYIVAYSCWLRSRLTFVFTIRFVSKKIRNKTNCLLYDLADLYHLRYYKIKDESSHPYRLW